jgi:cell division protein FtsX
MIQGLLSALFGLGILLGIYQTVMGSLSTLLTDTIGLYTLRFLPWSVVLGMTVGSLVVGYLGSALTLKRMLRILRTAS